MKVTKAVDKPAFTPVTLNMTFETEDELELFKEMISYDVSIPSLVYGLNKTKQDKLSELMSKIIEAL